MGDKKKAGCVTKLLAAVGLIILVGLGIRSCGDDVSAPERTKAKRRRTSRVTKQVAKRAKERDDVRCEYRIIEKKDLSYSTVVRTGFRIVVKRSVTEIEIRDICEDLIEQEKKIKPCNAISFFFYLPDTDVGGPYTAGVADWAPDGEWGSAGSVRTGDYSRHKLVIKAGSMSGGLTIKEREALTQQPDNRSGQVIGSWLNEMPYLEGRITIFRQNGKLFMEYMFKDGSSMKKEIVRKSSASGKKFEEKENGFCKFYLIDNQGNLQLWGQDGWVGTAKRIGD